jgi:sugar (pentulose or hexulose) kinase
MTRSRTFREALTAALGGAASFSPHGETSTLGAITCAAFGAGEGELQELAEKRKHEMRVWTTEAALTAEYKDLYEAWRARERRLTDIEL